MDTSTKIENVMLVLVETQQFDTEYALFELKELVRTAGGNVAATVVQKRSEIDHATIVGSGKLKEIKQIAEMNDVDIVVFNNNLSAVQRRNIEDVLERDVIDKTDLILDIFALHATSAEGKKQVELAQLTYSLAHRNTKNFSRQGGGIGTRGPGETQLETDKRVIRDRIVRLKQELADIESQRNVSRKQRLQQEVYTVALVGYTNAGKSTLFNLLTDNNVLAEDKLFATLDTTTRKIVLDNGITVLFTDTVGFIKDLPHNLINAFKSTLEETRNAHLILNVCDSSDSNLSEHIDVTQSLLASLGVTAPQILVYNKIDKDSSIAADFDKADSHVFVSAKTGKNVDILKEKITEFATQEYAYCDLIAPFPEYNKLLALLNKFAVKFDTQYDENVNVHALILRKYMYQFVEYLRK
jgi:GTP-binding protein HflX